MPTIAYIDKRFRRETLAMIEMANEIITEYAGQGFQLTLRQLYYQFVARDLIPNTTRSYKRLGDVINNARLAGRIDWSAIEDRTRAVRSQSHWDSPSSILRSAAASYAVDKWSGQEYRPEVWIEKEALAGVVDGVCRRLDISYLSCRGYTSQSTMWRSGQRIRSTIDAGQTPVILHLGDHDPSGIDMTRDIVDRIGLFAGDIEIRRLALNMDQVEDFGPPPNPAKMTDSRFDSYCSSYGDQSWELDALEPATLVDLIEHAVLSLRDEDKWDAAVARQEDGRKLLNRLAAEELEQ